ncbi:rhodanese-like domain-containing protein [Butyrivibrio sp. JL13D10]|uniref:rhodanese-like domain-containing protein n=1 Tax=Butyrivibrio sp. JL13D10 TaxID=3236815 RepID=UPI0038B4A3CB
MKYIKWLNLIPLIMFFIVDKLRGTLISRYLLIIIVALGVMNMFLVKGMKEYLISSLMLVVSTVVGMILYTHYYYYFVSANSEAPIFGAALMMVYGFIAFAVAAVGTVVVVIKDRYAGKTDINEEVENMKAIAGAVLLDVRNEDEFKEGHIPGSINIPLGNIEDVENKISDHDTPVFVYCLRGTRSAQAVSKMKAMGYNNAKSIGGIAAYKGQTVRI